MQKNGKDKIRVGRYKLIKKTKRLNGKTIKLKMGTNPLAAAFSIVVVLALIMVAIFSMPKVFNSVTYNKFLTQKNINLALASPNKTSKEYKAMVALEPTSGRVLCGFKENERLPMASTTKIMTAIVAIEQAQSLDEKVLVPPNAVGIEGSSMYLKKDEKFTIKELLYGLMLPSGNDAATALSILTCGTEENFVKEMNKKAQDLGLLNTQFKNPHGLHAEGHYTTASDLAKITAYAMKNEIFKEIVSTPKFIIDKTENNELRVFKNKQKLITDETLIKNGITVSGVKSGFTPEAGRCLVTSATNDSGLNVIVVVLNSPKMFESSQEILLEVFKSYSFYTLIEPKEHISSIPVVGSKKEEVKIYHNGSLKLPLTVKEKAQVKLVYNYPELLVAPVKNEQVVGEVVVFVGDEQIASFPIQTMEDAPNYTIFSIVKDITSKF